MWPRYLSNIRYQLLLESPPANRIENRVGLADVIADATSSAVPKMALAKQNIELLAILM